MDQLLDQQYLESHPSVAFILLLLTIWILVWKGLALWKAARKNHRAWFVALFILNTVGILDILYIYFFSERIKDSEDSEKNIPQ
jgi:methionyl-tRNA synthetase